MRLPFLFRWQTIFSISIFQSTIFRIIKYEISTVSITIIFQTIIAIDIDNSRIDRFISSIERKDKWSGCLLIAIDDSIINQRSCGYADYERKIPFTVNTSVNVSSTGKIFTGTLIVKLSHEGLLKFTDTIDKFFTGLPYGSEITIHQLLTHSSGLGAIDRELPDFSYENVTSCMDLMDFIKRIHVSLFLEPEHSTQIRGSFCLE